MNPTSNLIAGGGKTAAAAAWEPVAAAKEQMVALYAVDCDNEHLPARMVRREPGFYSLLLSHAVDERRRMVMVDGAFRFEIEVMACTQQPDGGYLAGCRVLGCREGTVRKEWRMLADLAAHVTVPLTGQMHMVRIRDMSPFGMGIEIGTELVRETSVIVDSRDGFGYGEVRYCRRQPDGSYFAGIYLREYTQKPDRSATRMQEQTRRWLSVLWNKLRFPLGE